MAGRRGGRSGAGRRTVTLAATGALRGTVPTAQIAPGARPAARCSAPALPGRVVDVMATDMMGGMMPGMMGGPDGRGTGWHGMAMMRLLVHPATVPAGTVSLRVVNSGAFTHEVIVLPLPTGQSVGQRPIGSDGRIDEVGSLGEASRSCGAGTGDGITPGASAWTTMTLQPGRYELVCNEPGHYAVGMYTELDVTAR
ncbi:hypothetical protein SCATT_27240 [Streptantibioticus cattleyicolor NRRL 8057 = DSM 46488]|uniref:Sulfocyanin-like C-terminal domain-containing protein n=2 Tax=Kitasatosporales TaxID=85011 RepID=G8X2H9_STREN|nr:hypothetical protein SCATT_27240 [Streptantibioticus cattleyicolor NRRL 8057 = DSM 46488]